MLIADFILKDIGAYVGEKFYNRQYNFGKAISTVKELYFNADQLGIPIGEIESNLINWKKKRMFIIVQQDIHKKPKATGKILIDPLFE